MSGAPLDLPNLNVSRETMARLHAFVGLLSKWTKKINLIAPGSIDVIWDRHIVDSSQLYAHACPDWESWTDIGSGGGLPGLVIAILDAEEKSRKVTLIESDTRKCLFLKTVRRELGLNVDVINDRISSADIAKSDILSARALAPFVDLLGMAEVLLKDDGIALFPKGERHQEEIDEALRSWHFDHLSHISQTNTDARVLEISRIRRREP